MTPDELIELAEHHDAQAEDHRGAAAMFLEMGSDVGRVRMLSNETWHREMAAKLRAHAALLTAAASVEARLVNCT